MTERQRLKLLTTAEGMRLSEEEEQALLSAWERYCRLVQQLSRQLTELEGEP